MIDADGLIGKLKLLGDRVIILTEDSFISVPSRGTHVICYNVTKNGILHKQYDKIVINKEIDKTDYFVGILQDEQHLLDKHMVILGKYPLEVIDKFYNGDYVLYNKYIVTVRTANGSKRLHTIKGKEITEGIASSLRIWSTDISDSNKQHGYLIVNYIKSNGVSEVKIINADMKSRKVGINLTHLDKVYPTLEGYIIEFNQPNKIVQYDFNDKVKLVIKHGSVALRSGEDSARYLVRDSFKHTIIDVPAAEKLY